ncbi:hypothetical protein LEP48_04395 [Isoptericola sp. NEAU-Y5]|uniref:Transcriptional regulator, AbiEi antitoxin, Type IV TA system n=1 Tax=Isoptericola luteus TaxID=2879484 RepID=A0ABS7ZFG9_9MICO|nr:hypothetical protein [Isoptericola sp. NEAU-Y5]MCA5892594.1 hypothetical protein [Isoptericola sp. NEAU-Y5]
MTTHAPRPGDRRDLDAPTVPPATRFSESRRAEIARRTATGDLQRVRKGVYLAPVDEDGPARARRAEVLRRVRAVQLRLTTAYWYSHTTAAVLHGCWTWRLSDAVHVTQLRAPNAEQSRERGLRRHWTALPPRDRTTIDGLPATTLERTVVDCARTLPPDQGLVVTDSALRGGADLDVLCAILDESAGRRGVRRAREVVDLADPRSESPGESLLRWVVHDAGLPTPEAGHRTMTRRGDVWLDLAWPERKVALEFDGAVKYSGGDYGDPAGRVFAEKLRQDALEEAGWLVVRVTWDDLHQAEALAARIRAALRTRSPRSRYPS